MGQGGGGHGGGGHGGGGARIFMIPLAGFLRFLLSFSLCQLKPPGIHFFVTFKPLLPDTLHATRAMNKGNSLRCFPECIPQQTSPGGGSPACQQRAEQETAVKMFPRNMFHTRHGLLLSDQKPSHRLLLSVYLLSVSCLTTCMALDLMQCS